MHYLFWDIAWVVVGVPCSYLLSRRFSSLRHRTSGRKAFTRKQSIQIALAIWIDGLILVVSAEAMRKYLWVPFLVWIVVNYGAIVIVLLRRRHNERPT